VTPDPACLGAILVDSTLRLEPMSEAHREALRTACAADPAIWDIYFSSFSGADFDPNFDTLLHGPGRVTMAVIDQGELIGMSGFINIAAPHRTLEIGTTYLAPDARGTGINARMKRLMIGHAFACGFTRIEFRVDTRNARSQAAMAKLGAVREGVLRAHLVTWTGHVRDSAIFSILKDEWT
jgi:RimJ/RimL family protein N-acetyltransferase